MWYQVLCLSQYSSVESMIAQEAWYVYSFMDFLDFECISIIAQQAFLAGTWILQRFGWFKKTEERHYFSLWKDHYYVPAFSGYYADSCHCTEFGWLLESGMEFVH